MKRLFKIAAMSLVMPLVMGVAGLCHTAHAGMSLTTNPLYMDPRATNPDGEERTFLVQNGDQKTFRASVICHNNVCKGLYLVNQYGTTLTETNKDNTLLYSSLCGSDPEGAWQKAEGGLKDALVIRGTRCQKPAGQCPTP